jgi:uncharacterized integral membrane protein (TIGR00698 family)
MPASVPGWAAGVLLTLGLAGAAMALSQVDVIGKTLGLGPVVLAIVLGAVLRNTVALPSWLQPGIRVSVKQVLSVAIVLLGFELSLQDVIGIGGGGLIVVTVVVGGTLVTAYGIGRALGLNRKLSALVATGCSICGTSAVVAADAVLDAGERDCAYAVAVVSVLGTVSMFALPLMQVVLSLPETLYGVWAGASIHSVGQAVAAGFAVGSEAGSTASLIKLTRVIYLAPVAVGLSLLAARWDRASGQTGVVSDKAGPRPGIPWFVIGFILVIGINSVGVVPGPATEALIQLDTVLLAMAMAAMGLEIRLDEMRNVGFTPLWAGALATVFITGLALAMAVVVF